MGFEGNPLVENEMHLPRMTHPRTGGVELHKVLLGVRTQPRESVTFDDLRERGELALSEEIVEAAQVDASALDRRVLELKGKSQPLDAWVEQPRMQPR